MLFPPTNIVLASLFLIRFAHDTYASALRDPVWDGASSRRLQAAVKHSDLLRRTDSLQPVYSTQLTYMDGENVHDVDDIFSSDVGLRSHKPFLVLENMEHLFKDIRCSRTSIQIVFETESSFNDARRSWVEMEAGHIIASQMGCVEEGSRIPFNIQSMVSSRENLTITFSVKEAKWNESFHGFRVNFGHSKEGHEPYTQSGLHRRQDPATPTSTELIASSLIPSDTATATATSLSIDLSHEGGSDNWFPGLQTTGSKLPIDIECKDCRTKGTLDLSQGEWDLLNPTDLLSVDSFTDIFSFGFVQFNLKDFLAHVELQITPSLEGSSSFALFTLTVPGVTGFTLPGIGAAGLLLEPQIGLAWKLSGGIELSYGFELQIPDLEITLNFSDPGSSQVTGLDRIDLSDVPFQANISDVELSVEVTLQPRVNVGIEFFDIATAVAGLFIDLPKTTAVLSQLATDNFDVNCEPLTVDSTGSGDQEDLQDLFQNLTHLSTGYEVGIGLDLKAGAASDVLSKLDFASSWPLLTTQLSQLAATQCLAWQPAATGGPAFANAGSALADAQRAAAATSAAQATATASGSAGDSREENGAFGRRSAAMASLKRTLCLYSVVFIAGVGFGL